MNPIIDAGLAARIPSFADRIIGSVAKELKTGRGGLYINFASPEDGTPWLIMMISKPEPDRVDRYLFNCQEKATRLASHPKHVLVSQSRDVNADPPKWSGGTRTPELGIWTGSGQPDDVDEAFMLVLAHRCGGLSEEDLWARAKMSNNGKNVERILRIANGVSL